MPGKPNTLRRAVVTAAVALIGLGAAAAVYVTSSRTASSRATRAESAAEAAAPAIKPGESEASAELGRARTEQASEHRPSEAAAPTAAPPSGSSRAISGTVSLSAAIAEESSPLSDLGGLAGSGYKFRLALSDFGAGIESVTLADHTTSAGKPAPFALQQAVRDSSGRPLATSMATVGVEIVLGAAAPAFVDLREGPGRAPVWRQTAPGEFEATILDASAAPPAPVARIRKRFVIQKGSYDIRVEERLVNLTAEPMTVRWYSYGPIELPSDSSGYGIDVRRFRYGALRSAQQDPSRQFPEGDNRLTPRRTLVDPATQATKQVWPTDDSIKQGRELVWLALTSRYFAFAVHPIIDASAPAPDKRLAMAETVHRVLVRSPGAPEALVLQVNSPPVAVAANGSLEMAVGAYAGPMRPGTLAGDPMLSALGLGQLVVYNLGGPCSPCTFPVLAHGLIWFLRLAHDNLLFDWSLAIMVLVLAVRTALHPITRRSQIGLAKFSKQMQALGPKQAAIREKHKDNPRQMQVEMARLMKEEGVNFRGALGCLPIFLQMPIWIALYAMLFFAFELRHEAGFFGVFQAVSGGRWGFLADLSAPDHFIEFSKGVHIPIVSSLGMGEITGINILPLILGVVFFVQQKYMTPPPTTTLSPEMEMQQKMMKWMMVVMFPLMMFNAPSGLAIYFITNSTLGIIESRWIRKHINRLTAGDAAKAGGAKPGAAAGRKVEGPPGFWQRVQAEAMKRAEQKQGGGARPGTKPRR